MSCFHCNCLEPVHITVLENEYVAPCFFILIISIQLEIRAPEEVEPTVWKVRAVLCFGYLLPVA